MVGVLSDSITQSAVPLLFDGAIGTALSSLCHETVLYPEGLNVTNPSIVAELHRGYILSGAQVITTNTFQANQPAIERWPESILKGCDFESRPSAYELCRQGAGIALDVASSFPQRVLIAGSLSPLWYPKNVGKEGVPRAEERKNLYSRQVQGIVDGGGDFILWETLFHLEEAELIVEVMADFSIEWAMTFSFQKTKDRGFVIASGHSLEEVTAFLSATNCSLAGANCVYPFDLALELLERFSLLTKIPLLLQPNGGLPVEGKYTLFEDDVVRFAESLSTRNVAAVGGCCGTDRRYTEILRRVFESSGWKRENIQTNERF